MSVRQRRCQSSEIGVAAAANGHGWPAREAVIASVTGSGARYCVLALPEAVLTGEALTGFLNRVAPFGCPVPGSLIRAYSLPDAPFPSILLKEHEAAPDGLAEAYLRFLYTDEAQEIIAKWGYRPQNAEILAKHRDTLPAVRKLFTIRDVAGSWHEAQKKYFSTGGLFDQIYQPR